MKILNLFFVVILCIAVFYPQYTIKAQCVIPTDVSVTSTTSNSADLIWDSDINAFEVKYRDSFSSFISLVVDKPEISLSGLDPETQYRVKIRALCAGGTSKWTDLIRFTTYGTAPICEPPQEINYSVSGLNNVKLSLSWEEGDPNDSYSLRYATDGTYDWTILNDINTTSIITDFQPEVPYKYMVQKKCASGRSSSWSATQRLNYTAPVVISDVHIAFDFHEKAIVTAQYQSDYTVISSGVFYRRGIPPSLGLDKHIYQVASDSSTSINSTLYTVSNYKLNYIVPFVETDQGFFYGELQSFYFPGCPKPTASIVDVGANHAIVQHVPSNLGPTTTDAFEVQFRHKQSDVWKSTPHIYYDVELYDYGYITEDEYLIVDVPADTTYIGWGYNEYGKASPPIGLSNVKQLSAGGEFAMALLDNGTLISWGNSSFFPPADLGNVVQVSAGKIEHGLALLENGTVVGWGNDLFYEDKYNYVGPDYNEGFQGSYPDSLTDIVAISAGFAHNNALKSDGTVITWGLNWVNAVEDKPSDLKNVKKVVTGNFHSLALLQDSTVVSWGANYKTDTIYPLSYDENAVLMPENLHGVVDISTGGEVSLALLSDGSVVQWGKIEAPVPDGLMGVVKIASSSNQNYALLHDGTLVTWGGGNLTPIPENLQGVTDVFAGTNYVIVKVVNDSKSNNAGEVNLEYRIRTKCVDGNYSEWLKRAVNLTPCEAPSNLIVETTTNSKIIKWDKTATMGAQQFEFVITDETAIPNTVDTLVYSGLNPFLNEVEKYNFRDYVSFEYEAGHSYSYNVKTICDDKRASEYVLLIDEAQSATTRKGDEAILNFDAVLVYPTLADDQITIESLTDTSYEILNALGQRITAGVLQSGNNLVTVSNLKTGTYFITIDKSVHQFFKQ